MSRKDKRPESRPERNMPEEISDKATDPGIFNAEAMQGQTQGANERGPQPGQYYDKGPGSYTHKGTPGSS